MTQILFPVGVRLSTWVFVFAFGMVAAWRSDRAPLLAGVAWLAGFETAYQAAAMTLHTPSPVPVIGGVSLSLLIGMPAIFVLVTIAGARVYPPLLFAALVVFAVWLVSGFHVNTPHTAINPGGEALNDAAKTLWAFAYLVPLWAGTQKSRPIPKDRPAETTGFQSRRILRMRSGRQPLRARARISSTSISEDANSFASNQVKSMRRASLYRHL